MSIESGPIAVSVPSTMTSRSPRAGARTAAASATDIAAPVLGGERVEARLHFWCEPDLRGRERRRELLGPARAEDGRRDGGMRQDPGDGHRRDVEPGVARDARERARGLEHALVPV